MKFLLSFFSFSYENFQRLLVTWQKNDSFRLACDLLTPYAHAYTAFQAAVHAQEKHYQMAAKKQMSHLRLAMVQLIGKEVAFTNCRKVEAAINAGMNFVMLTQAGNNNNKNDTKNVKQIRIAFMDPIENSPSSQEKQNENEQNEKKSNNQTTTNLENTISNNNNNNTKGLASLIDTNEAIPIPQGIGSQLLRNERLAHELILDPEFRISKNKKEENKNDPSYQIKETM